MEWLLKPKTSKYRSRRVKGVPTPNVFEVLKFCRGENQKGMDSKGGEGC